MMLSPDKRCERKTMKFKCLQCRSNRASIREEKGYSVEHCNLDRFPINSEIWDKDWRLYCFYGVQNRNKDGFYLVCSSCSKLYGPQRKYNQLVRQLQSDGVLLVEDEEQ